MGTLRTAVLLLSVLPPSVYGSGSVSHTLVCYSLDAFLLLYCVVFTVFFFREKYKRMHLAEPPQDDGTYQELERPKDSDPYQVLQPTKPKKKAAKKKKNPEAAQKNPGLVQPLTGRANPPAPQ